jgi:hypothetical protein
MTGLYAIRFDTPDIEPSHQCNRITAGAGGTVAAGVGLPKQKPNR